MFHKALWTRNWKQGKYVIILFWITLLYNFPLDYHRTAQRITENMRENDWYYMYHFNIDALQVPNILLIILATILIGWERNQQSDDFLFSMPFKRKHIFLSKWLFGVIHIFIALLITWGLMYIVYNTTIHSQYQSFYPFHILFIYGFISLVAMYSLALFIGTITGNVVAQGGLSYIIMIFPFHMFQLLFGAFTLHTELYPITVDRYYDKGITYVESVSITAPINPLSIHYDYDPEASDIDQFGNEIHSGPNFNEIPSPLLLLSPVIYILISLSLGIYLYQKTPVENNGKLLLYPRLHIYFSICTSFCFGLLGAEIFQNGSSSLLKYYLYFIGCGGLTYVILKRLLKQKLSLPVK